MARTSHAISMFAVLIVSACRPAEKPPEAPAALVIVETASLTDYDNAAAVTGAVQARFQTDLAFRVSGRVVERHVDVGDRVGPGDLLARLDPREQQADLDAANANVEAADAQLEQATSEFDRQQVLFQQGLTTRTVFEQAQEAVRTAQASLDAARAQMATAQDAHGFTELRATAAGVVTERDIEVGQVVQAAETAYSVAEDGPRDAVFYVYERMLFEKPSSKTIRITLATDPSVETTGQIREISPAVDADSGTVRVKVAVDDVPARMNLGSAVVGHALLPGGQGVVLPWSALASDAGLPAVWILDPVKGTTELRRVTIGSYATGRIILSDGVRAGEQVIVDGTKFLRPGEAVSVLGEEPS